MFKPRTEKIEKIAKKFPKQIKELEWIFSKNTAVYIDFANVIPRQDKLRRKIDIKRLKQFLDSFSNVKKIVFYYGTLEWDEKSEKLMEDIKNMYYTLVTKPVKIMRKSIDMSSIEKSNPSILNSFIRKSLLKEMSIANIEYINEVLVLLNDRWIFFIEDRKCNFDVEMWADMLLDLRDWEIETFVIRTGDSDFQVAVDEIDKQWKNTYVFSIPGRVSSELNHSSAKIYNIKQIRNFICRNKFIQEWILE